MITQKNFNTHLQEVRSLIDRIPTVIPAHRAAFKKGYSFSNIPFEDQLLIWDYIWHHSNNFWGRLHAYFFLEKAVTEKEHHAAIWDTSVAWQELVSDWGLCDALAKINTKVLESYPAGVYKQLAAWNKDTDLWKRRQSVVSLLYYSRTKKVYLPYSKIAALITPLLADKEYYVQKGIGWALREVHTVYPEETMPLLNKHIKNISPIAFTIAMEKMSTEEKNALKALRKK